MTTHPRETPSLRERLLDWAFGPYAGLILAAAFAGFGAVFTALEFVRPRYGLRLPFEEQPGFYAAVGAGAVVAALLAGAALRWLLLRDHPYTDELDRAGDGDHA